MFRTFNMGIGMVIVCAEANAETIETELHSKGQLCYRIGTLFPGRREVTIV